MKEFIRKTLRKLLKYALPEIGRRIDLDVTADGQRVFVIPYPLDGLFVLDIYINGTLVQPYMFRMLEADTIRYTAKDTNLYRGDVVTVVYRLDI